MTKQTENLITKIMAVLFASLLTVTGWLAKSEITSMATTLKEIRKDVSHLNTRSLLQEQKFRWLEDEINKIDRRFSKLEVQR